MHGDLLAESTLRQLHARYIDATWRQDVAAFKSCFTPDGEWQIAGMHLRGREEIGAAFGKLTTGSSRVLMTVGMLLLEIDGETATGAARVTETIKREDGQALRTIGSYRDQYQNSAGEWRFRARQWRRHYFGPMDLSAPLDN